MELFEPGNIRMTAAVYHWMEANPDFREFALSALDRHLCGDWGDLYEEDRDLNNAAMVNGDRILSVYLAPCAEGKLWIHTEADRSLTMIMFPSEY